MHSENSAEERAKQVHEDFDSNDKETRRKVLRSRNLREMARPWRATNNLVRVLNVRTKENMTFHAGARVK